MPSNIVNAQDREGCTALYIAASLGYKDIVESLVEEFGAALEIANVDGLTPLHAAAIARQYYLVNFFLSKHANASATTSDGSTLLHLLAENLSSDRRERSEERTDAENIIRKVVKDSAS
ncbi:MAG: ankyrin repeat domain-containing protein, partial [Phycisphaerales bacterium]|nr:ankyrin repeat domain-containing protein [Phycisphaerales bacterium]